MSIGSGAVTGTGSDGGAGAAPDPAAAGGTGSDGRAGAAPDPAAGGAGAARGAVADVDERLRLLVVDDHPVVRSGIVGMLSSEEGLDVVGEAADGEKAVALAAELDPDVVLMDLRMPVLDGVGATRRITGVPAAGRPAPRVVVLTTYDTDGDILRAVEAGAIGYLLKDSPREDIVAAVRAAADGRSALSPSVTTRLVGAARGGSRVGGGGPQTPVTLSPREREVLAAAAHGLSNAAIGKDLLITEATVKTHLLRSFTKLGVETRTAAVTEALRRGLLELE